MSMLASGVLAAGGATLVAAAPVWAVTTAPCSDGTTPAVQSTVTCSVAGAVTLTVPAGTTSVDVDVVGGGGGAGYPARSHIGGNAAEVTGTLTLPPGTRFLFVITGAGGGGDNHGIGYGGGGSGVFALGSNANLIAKLVIAGGGGAGSYNGDGGAAGSAGTSENAALAAPGQPGSGATGGAGGAGNYSAGQAGAGNAPAALTIAAGGAGGTYPNNSAGGYGGGGYGGGGGGATGNQGILNIYEAGGGGGSSLASASLASPSVGIAPGTGGVQLPGLIAGDGATGSVELTFNGLAAPGAPTAVSATPGDSEATVSFTAPDSDNGSPITSYTVTASPGGGTKTCPGSPCVVTGLSNGTSYTFTVHATNANGDSVESSASDAVTPAVQPGAPGDVEAVAGDAKASVSFAAPGSTGGSPITSYTVTASPGGSTKTCPGSPCVVTGLSNGTSYTFTVHATNAIGDSVESAASAAVTPVGKPGVPGDVSATPGDSQASVSFAEPGSGGSPITAYTVTASPGGSTKTCPASPCVVTGLSNGTAYTFTVHATNAEGDSAESSASAAVTPAAKPGAPGDVVAVAGNGAATVSFATPSTTGGSPITGYTVTSAPGGITATCPASLCEVTGLTNGTSYTFTVRAANAIGDSVASAASAAVTPVGPPGVPTGVTATPASGQASVRFTAPASTGGSPITGYTVTATPGGATATCAASPCVVTGLSNGTSYTFTVRATTALGNSPESVASAAVVPAVPPVPSASVPGVPGAVTATAATTSIRVSFGKPEDGGSAVTAYEISLNGGTSWTTLEAGGNPVTGTASGLRAGTRYSVSVRAVNAMGAGAASSPVTVTTLPASPDKPTASAGTSSVTVSWPAAADETVTGYTVRAEPGPATCSTSSRTETSCVIGAAAGTSYTYTVIAHSPQGDSVASSTSEPVVAEFPEVPAQAPGNAPATLTTTEGRLTEVEPGRTITLVGTGFAPHSTVTALLYSDPVTLGSVVTDAAGSFTKEITVPAELDAGTHQLVASGVDPDGSRRMIRMPVRVQAEPTTPDSPVPPGSPATPDSPAAPSSGGSELPRTGAPVAVLASWAALIMGAGLGLVVASRVQSRSSTTSSRPLSTRI
ncbi:fibronectin type III domain-containing protein [Actinoplanes sp. N902-109]|nr:fibronectin type III domain-containing protein [Actinoplanes sp. N902-109]